MRIWLCLESLALDFDRHAPRGHKLHPGQAHPMEIIIDLVGSRFAAMKRDALSRATQTFATNRFGTFHAHHSFRSSLEKIRKTDEISLLPSLDRSQQLRNLWKAQKEVNCWKKLPKALLCGMLCSTLGWYVDR